MAWTQAQLDALQTAAANGVLRVAYADRTVQFHSLDEMLRLIATMQADIAGDSASGTRTTFASPSRD